MRVSPESLRADQVMYASTAMQGPGSNQPTAS
jgi:hypothetical protein